MSPPFTGKAYFQAHREQDGHLLFVAVPCHLGRMGPTVWALLDTAAEWCVLSQSVVDALGEEVDLLGLPVTLQSRFGALVGEFGRITITFPAAEGEPLAIDA